jgi:transposase-like protein
MMNLRALVEKTPDADLLREMIGFAAQRQMELEVESLTGAGYGEKSPQRLVQRNGYRERDWETRAGTVELHIPKLRKGATSRASWSRVACREGAHRRGAGGLRAGRLHPLGRRLVQAMGMSGISKSQVSRLCAEIDEKVKAFLSRPIEGDYLWIDATYVKVRQNGRIVDGRDHRGGRQQRWAA